jgi:hypothetical protein
MNPIEHLRHILKTRIIQNHPELQDMDVSAAGFEALQHAIIKGWDTTTQEQTDALIASMPTR